MNAARMAGYTLVEVSLFLAISGLLFIIAIVGTGSVMRSIRFTDTGRSTHAYIQKQYDEILNGVNPRDNQQICGSSGVEAVSGPGVTGSQPGASGCLLLGKLLRLEQGSDHIDSYYVVATRIPNLSVAPDATLNDEELIRSVNPFVVKETRSEYTIPWGAAISGSRRSDGTAANTYALLRSPRSSRLVSYNMNIQPADFTATTFLAPVLTAAAAEKITNYCLQTVETPASRAVFTVGGQGQNAIQVAFDVANEGVCDGA
ncbi:MAG TPA: hypothetical protein VFZ58_03805 [Candidatus Saccharimonadales bacterium]